MPKEVRNPKSDGPCLASEAKGAVSIFAPWGKDADAAGCALHEGSGGGMESPPNLMERTAHFGEAILRFVKRIPRGMDCPENNRIVDQLVGSATSIGANYCEADDAVSGKDFRNKIGTCRKESKETMFFLRVAAASEPGLAEDARKLWREAKELNLIFGSIWRRKG